MSDHKKHIDFYESFVQNKDAGNREAMRRRAYVNNQQHTDEERDVLRRRKQPVITDNQIKRKTDYFLGVERQTRTDPKAYPRTPEHEEGAEAITDGLRYVCDNSEWDIERSEGFDYLIVEGIEAYIVPVEKTPDGFDIKPRHIPFDRIIYDFYSRDRYFRDANKKGVVTWMDKEEALDMFPGKEDIVEGSFSEDESTIFDDRPGVAWCDAGRDRVKVIQLYYLKKGVWMHCVFTKAGYLIDPEESPYQDEYGRPDCPIEFAGAYIDSDNDRFGLVEDMISLQDMLNKMESKYMHYINSNQTYGNQKIQDVAKLKTEAKKPDGHMEIQGDGVFGQDFGIVPTDNKAISAFNLLNHAMESLNEIGGNSIVADSASGRSKEITQQTKNIELGAVLDTHRQCSKRVYRQIHNRMKQFWTARKWIRVTDDEDNLKFVEFNKPVTYAEMFEAKYGEGWQQQFPNLLMHPNINDVVEIQNQLSEIDVDIVIEEAPDVINIQQEQFALMAKLAETYGPEHVPFEEVLKLSTLRNKDGFIERTKGNEQQRQQNEQMMAQKRQQSEQMQMQAYMAELQEKASKAKLNEAKAAEAKSKAMLNMADEEKTDMEAEAQEIENELTVASVNG